MQCRISRCLLGRLVWASGPNPLRENSVFSIQYLKTPNKIAMRNDACVDLQSITCKFASAQHILRQ